VARHQILEINVLSCLDIFDEKGKNLGFISFNLKQLQFQNILIEELGLI